MRKVGAAEYVILDGVTTDPGGVGEIEHGGWSNAYFNDELGRYQSDQLFASDALLLGRVTFAGFAAVWALDGGNGRRRDVIGMENTAQIGPVFSANRR